MNKDLTKSQLNTKQTEELLIKFWNLYSGATTPKEEQDLGERLTPEQFQTLMDHADSEQETILIGSIGPSMDFFRNAQEYRKQHGMEPLPTPEPIL